MFNHFQKDENEDFGALELGLVAALVAVVIIVALTTFGNSCSGS